MKIKYLSFILPLALLLFLIVGCSSKDTQVDKKAISEFDSAPTWIHTKKIDYKISDIGSAKQAKLSFIQQRDKATKNAQKNLSKKLHTQILNIFKLLKEPGINEKLYAKNVTIATKEILKNALKNAKLMKLWQSNSETFYVLVATDIQKIKDDFKISVATTFKEMPAIKSNYTLQLEQGNIDIQLNQ